MSDFNFSFDVGNNVANMLREVAHQLGITVDKIYPYFVYQQFVSGIIGVVSFLITAILTLGGTILVFKMFLKAKKDVDDEVGDEDCGIIKMMALGVFGVIMLVFFMITLSDFLDSHYIAMIFNPHYYAIKDMLLTSHQLIHR
jgi:hypothetical protein